HPSSTSVPSTTLFRSPDTSLYKPALQSIKTFIKTSTSSMTAVPKPLKFLRPHYAGLEKAYESWPEGENKVRSPRLEKSANASSPDRKSTRLNSSHEWI